MTVRTIMTRITAAHESRLVLGLLRAYRDVYGPNRHWFLAEIASHASLGAMTRTRIERRLGILAREGAVTAVRMAHPGEKGGALVYRCPRPDEAV